MNETIIANRYAQAFLNHEKMDEKVIPALLHAIDYFKKHKRIFSLLKVPLLDAQIKKNALIKVLIYTFNLPASFEKLIDLLIVHKRSYLIKEVLKQIIEVFEDRQGIERFEIQSSVALEKSQIDRLNHFLQTQTKHRVMISTRENKKLIAGIRMQSEYHIWEHSIAKQLKAMRQLASQKENYGDQND